MLSEHRIADFDAFKAIGVLGTSGVEVPLIVVSGAIGEETALGPSAQVRQILSARTISTASES